MKLPLIDFADFDIDQSQTLGNIGKEIESALTTVGFMAVKNLDFTAPQLKEIFQMSRGFFDQSLDQKNKSIYRSAAENFGFQTTGVEHLDPTQASDIKETFTMRDLLSHDPKDDRWPSEEFRDEVTRFYQNCISSAHKIQRVFAVILGTSQDFFVDYHNGENISLRLLHYPPTTLAAVQNGQLGAGAHTDYGMLTLLFQDNIGGLQVLDGTSWVDVEPVEGAIVVNTGDLMERWTNGKFKSTLHRVQPRIGTEPRSSIAVFIDPDSNTQVEALESCINDGMPAKYDPITAGEHIQEKISASHVVG